MAPRIVCDRYASEDTQERQVALATCQGGLLSCISQNAFSAPPAPSRGIVMTIAVAWVRSFKNTQELVFASDSRLSGGRTFDAAPKILMLPRSDCAIAFAGYTGDAYPLMHHLAFAIDANRSLASRAMDLTEFRPHLLKVMDETVATIASVIPELEKPDVGFLVGGYSWLHRNFKLWRIVYDSNLKKFVTFEATHAQTNPIAKKVFFGSASHAGEIRNSSLGQIAFAGDQAGVARTRFCEMLQARLTFDPIALETAQLDYEPFEVVRDMLRDPKRADTIGGAPQLLKVYQHMNVAPLVVYWPNRKGSPHLAGRPLLGYERIDRWCFDPDALRSWNTNYSTDEPDHSIDAQTLQQQISEE
jgi:hypothetical protein